jgi:hypothetical protein
MAPGFGRLGQGRTPPPQRCERVRQNNNGPRDSRETGQISGCPIYRTIDPATWMRVLTEALRNRHLTRFGFQKAEKLDILFLVYPDDSGKELATVLSYLAGRSLSREEIWTAMELPRSTYYDQLDKGTLITADNLRIAAANLGINRAELLTRYRFIDPEEVTALAEEIRGGTLLHAAANGHVKTAVAPTKLAEWRPRQDAPPL